MLETRPHFKKTNVWDNYQIEHMCGLLWLEALVCNLDKKKTKNKDNRQTTCVVGVYDLVGVRRYTSSKLSHKVECDTR